MELSTEAERTVLAKTVSEYAPLSSSLTPYKGKLMTPKTVLTAVSFLSKNERQRSGPISTHETDAFSMGHAQRAAMNDGNNTVCESCVNAVGRGIGFVALSSLTRDSET